MKVSIVVAAVLCTSWCAAQPAAPISKPASCPAPQVSGTPPIAAAGAPSGTADLNSVITSVTTALRCYEDTRGSGPDALPHLQQAQFDFKTTTGKIGGVTVSFFIFKLGASKENDTTNQLSFTYSLPKPAGAGHALKFAKPPQLLTDALVADIQSAAAAVKARAKIDNLTFSKLTITLQYGVQFDGNVAVNVPVQLVTIGASYDGKRNDVQTITLTFSASDQ